MIRFPSRIKITNLFLGNLLRHNSKALTILMFILSKMRMFMIQECRMKGQMLKIY
jgi:hypothetical protein